MESEEEKKPVEVADMEDGDEEDEDMEDEASDGQCSEDETPDRDPSVPVHEFMVDCSYEAIKICNIDFLTDFGSAEPFLIDGDALVAYALSNPYLNRKCGLQTLQVVHIIETTLARMMERGAKFEIFFFAGNAVLWREYDKAAEMARYITIQHFVTMNRVRQLSGQTPLANIHILPGSWWDPDSKSLPALVEQCGPSYIMTDFGWCGAEGRTLHITRAFVNYLHLQNLHIVTLADFELDGSHIISNNMQPPRHPKAQEKLRNSVDELLAMHRPWLSTPVPAPAANGPATFLAVSEAKDIREAVLVAAMKYVATSCSDAGKANAVALCVALALAGSVPLSARCLPFTDAAFDRC
jgi:hypothetical protein